MPRVKIQLADNIKRVVVVDTDATRGAKLGTDLFMASGQVATPALVRDWLGLGSGGADIRNGYGIAISGTSPKTVSVNRAANFDWQGQHSWEKPLHGPDGSAALPAYAFTGDPDTGAYRIGANNYGIATGGTLRWDVSAARVRQINDLFLINPATSVGANEAGLAFQLANSWQGFSGTPLAGITIRGINPANPTGGHGGEICFKEGHGMPAYGFRLHWTGEAINEGNLEWYRYNNNNDPGVLFLLMRRDTSQVNFTDGTPSAPVFSFIGDDNTGLFRPGADQIGFATGGVSRFAVTSTQLTGVVPWRGVNGAAGAPAYSFNGDADTGVYLHGANMLGVATAGVTRFLFGASGQLGLGGADFGTLGQVLVSGGSGAPPTWGSAFTNDYYEPVANGDAANPEVVFFDGDVVVGVV